MTANTNLQTRAKVSILTGSYQIKGYVELINGARITDLMNGSKEFIAVTEAEVYEVGGNLRHVLSTPFLNVCRNHIQIIAPL
ncbi:conserved protein of unknown function [Sterolibacterium denitrificans]|uniref:Uncharacterized protein n=2 Tax=Sterolibacterium denitrificans TaxID=157592 RepID=A0A7Z7HNG3_9PROT|nr:hypothetical protein [Sterolibacterium denitrificans]KYC28866.1 hypothetical protein ACY05_04115 [Sterolibacterium denitrificans]SMB21140.1 conserved protein of unknown function [Sterolibacterium denitrificans]